MKRFLKLLAAGVALAAATHAPAQSTYPNQPVRWIVPYVAGGGTDNLARALAEAMQPSLGQPLLIDNRPGASTNIGVSVLMQSKPDGYTIMQAENAALLFNEHMFAKLPYKPASDFTYIERTLGKDHQGGRRAARLATSPARGAAAGRPSCPPASCRARRAARSSRRRRPPRRTAARPARSTPGGLAS